MKNENKKKITESRFRKNFQNITKVGYVHRIKPYNTVSFHWHDFYELEMNLGEGETTIDSTTYQFKHGIISLISPASMHSFDVIQPTFEGFNIQFNIEHLESEKVISQLSGSKSAVVIPDEKQIEWYAGIFNELEKNFDKSLTNNKLYTTKILEFLIMNILNNGIMVDNPLFRPSGKAVHLIPHAVLYIQKHFRENIKVKDVADTIFLSEKYFCSLFRETLGCSFSQYLNDIRLKNACNMLVTATDTVTEIARESGFNSTKHFQRLFKEKYNITPLEYRKKNI